MISEFLSHLVVDKLTSDCLGGVRVLVQWHRKSMWPLTQKGSLCKQHPFFYLLTSSIMPSRHGAVTLFLVGHQPRSKTDWLMLVLITGRTLFSVLCPSTHSYSQWCTGGMYSPPLPFIGEETEVQPRENLVKDIHLIKGIGKTQTQKLPLSVMCHVLHYDLYYSH